MKTITKELRVIAYQDSNGRPACACNHGVCRFLKSGFHVDINECQLTKSKVKRDESGWMRPNSLCEIWKEDLGPDNAYVVTEIQASKAAAKAAGFKVDEP